MGLEDEYALTGWFTTILIASKLSKKMDLAMTCISK